MQAQNKAAAACYAFLGGIALSMRWPGLLGCWPLALALAGILAAFAGGLAILGRRRASANRGILPALLACGLACGVARHTASDHRRDLRVARCAVQGRTLQLTGRTAWDHATRLRLRKDSPGHLTLRLEGVLDALQPIRDTRGTPAMDARGRWRFHRVRSPQVSTDVQLPDDLPVGSEVEVDVPFSAVTNAVLLAGTDGFQASVVLVSPHVASFAKPGRDTPPVTILGRILDDPSVFSQRTVLTVQPAYLQETPDGPFLRIREGRIRVTVSPGLPGYGAISQTGACGNDVVLTGELQLPQAASNPGGFDNRRYLANLGVFGQMFLWPSKDRSGAVPLRVVAPEDGTPRTAGGLVMFSLRLRDRMLRVIKQTLPFPHSAFAGGVTLGLRNGIVDAECVLSPSTPQEGLGLLRQTHEPCSDFISEEFRRSGVNHVLAVSGLHVTIITVMLVGIFSALRLSRKVTVPIVLLALVVFAIITGARPSTLRAVIMNGLFLLSWAYLEQSLRASVLLATPIAASLILLQTPGILTDPAFTLSFGAILSLALLTGPCHRVLSRFRGNDLVVLGLVVVAAHAVVARDWLLATAPFFQALFLAGTLALFAAGRALAARGIRLAGNRGFGDLPSAVHGFLAAQCGIQLGMMIPLSAYYFSRWSVAGAAANLVAIPLIGVVLQLAMLACLVGLIPGIGLYAALWLNAANWLASTFFMLVAHHAAHAFPYPFVPRPDGYALAVYYAAVGLFAAWPQVAAWLQGVRWWKLRPVRRAVAFAALALLLSAWPRPPQADGQTRLTFLSVGYGSSALLQTPDGKNILIDSGYALRDRNRAIEAERNVLPYLCRLGIRDLDALVLLSARPERISGAAQVLKHCRVRKLILPEEVAALFDARRHVLPEALEDAFGSKPTAVERESIEALAGRPGPVPFLSLSEVLSDRRPTWFNRMTGRAVRLVAASPRQMIMFPKRTHGGDFALELLAVPHDQEHPMDSGTLALRVRHGTFAALFPGDLDYEGIGRLMAEYDPDDLRAQVLVSPGRGAFPPGIRSTDARFEARLSTSLSEIIVPLLRSAGIRHVVSEFGNPRPVLKDGRPALRAHDITQDFYRRQLGDTAVTSTETDGAIGIATDGRTFDLHPLRP